MNLKKAHQKSKKKKMPVIAKPKSEPKVEPKVIERPVVKAEPEEILVEVEVLEVPIEEKKIVKPEPKKKSNTRPVSKPKKSKKPDKNPIATFRNEEMKAIVSIMNAMDPNEIPMSGPLFGADRKGHNSPYNFTDKVRALHFLRAMCYDKGDGKLTPNFEWVAKLSGIHKDSLKTWWSQREIILGGAQGLVSEIQTHAIYELSMLQLEAITLLRDKMSTPKDVSADTLNRIINIATNKLAIMKGQTTQKKRVDHFHHLPVNTIAPDTS